MDPSKPTHNLNELLKMGNNVKIYHLPNYAKYDLRHNHDGSRTFNPLSLSRLCSNLAVANTDPKDVQRYDQDLYVTSVIIVIFNFAFCNSFVVPII